MDERERPNLTLGALAEITDYQNDADQGAWEVLRPMLNPKGWNENTRFSGPRPPKLTARFYLILSNYANELFYSEVQKYPRYPPHIYFPDWLRNLARRVEDHVIAVVKDIEASDPEKDFSYHGVVEDEMRRNIRQRLHAEMEQRFNIKYLTSATELLVQIMEPLARTAQIVASRAEIDDGPTIQRQPATQASRRAVIEPLLDAKGWSILDWANEAEVAHATAMDFLDEKTRPYRSTRFKLAKALGISVDQLPR